MNPQNSERNSAQNSAGPAQSAQAGRPAQPAAPAEPALDAEQSARSADSTRSTDPAHSARSAPGGTVRPGGAWPASLLLDDELGETADEAALRLLMQDAVSGLQPAPDALDHLRRAVPARRQRRRQAMVGAAAVVLLAGMAIPALLRATGATGTADTAATGLASAHTGAPDEDGHTSAWGDSGVSTGEPPPGRPGDVPTTPPLTPGPGTDPANPPVSTSGTLVAVPDCSSTHLGQGTSQAETPDSNGQVYGWFRVTNVSDLACAVPNAGVVQAFAQGAADPSKIQVVDHTDGDAATGLPAATAGPVVLNPGDDYEVAFAFVPVSDGNSGCPVTPTPTPTTPTPTDSPTESPATTGGSDSGTSGNSASTQLGNDAPASPDPGSITLSHTPAAGAPVVDGPVIQGACAGTVYTTTAIPEAAATPAS
jgi:hypothetical protein